MSLGFRTVSPAHNFKEKKKNAPSVRVSSGVKTSRIPENLKQHGGTRGEGTQVTTNGNRFIFLIPGLASEDRICFTVAFFVFAVRQQLFDRTFHSVRRHKEAVFRLVSALDRSFAVVLIVGKKKKKPGRKRRPIRISTVRFHYILRSGGNARTVFRKIIVLFSSRGFRGVLGVGKTV